MARLSIDIPGKFLFETELVVRANDLNYGNHLGHDSVLTLCQEARIIFYRQLGFKDELSFDGSIGQVIADAAVVYKSESFLGDVLKCQIGIRDVTKYGFDMVYVLTNTANGREVARCKTGIVCFDYNVRKVAAIPEVLLSKLK